MKSNKPIKDIYFRFLKGSSLETMTPQEAALRLSKQGLIELVPNKTKPQIDFWCETERLETFKEEDLKALFIQALKYN